MICVDWFDPGTRAGGPIRSCVNLIGLLNKDVHFSVLTGDRDLGADDTYPGIRPGEWNNWKGQTTVWYATLGQHIAGAFLRASRTVRPATIYLNSMFSVFGAVLPLLIHLFLGANTRLVIAPRGMLKDSALSMKRWKKIPWLKFLHFSGISGRVVFHATSAQEADEVRSVFGTSVNVKVAPNIPCVPVEHVRQRNKQPGTLAISFAGRVHPVKNLQFLLRLLQTAKGTYALNVIGPIEDTAYYGECQKVVAELPPNVSVTFSGAVSNDDMVRQISDSDVMVLPTLGENFGHSIFEAFSIGVPVVISDQTYWRNLEADRAGWDLNLAEPDRFCLALEQLAQMENTEYQHWQTGAHRRAIRFFEENDLKTAYMDLLFGK